MITRFAPSPTGPLHLGHAYSAWLAFRRAQDAGGTFLLRIEDIDRGRSRPEWEALIYQDLRWLGLDWPEPVMRQSERLPAYRAALGKLWHQGLLYPCSCSRQDIRKAVEAPQEGVPRFGPDGIVYPGTCRPAAGWHPVGELPDAALRLDIHRAVQRLPADLAFLETGAGPAGESGEVPVVPADLIAGVGDVVLARRDMGTSYHLAVVLDDAEQSVTEVVRGEDLFEATAIHVLLQQLLGAPVPVYHHHPLVRDGAGRRLAKRDDARAIRLFRDEGRSPEEVRRLAGATV